MGKSGLVQSGTLFSNQKATVIWLTGLPCSGKTTLATGLAAQLQNLGFTLRLLDGDVTRRGICNDLGFSDSDRTENIRRIAEVSKLFVESGIITINAFITPTEHLRNMAKQIIGAHRFISVFVNAPLALCEQRDVKGMYLKARMGEIANFTGVSAPFEQPLNPDFVLDTMQRNEATSVNELLHYILPKIKAKNE